MFVDFHSAEFLDRFEVESKCKNQDRSGLLHTLFVLLRYTGIRADQDFIWSATISFECTETPGASGPRGFY